MSPDSLYENLYREADSIGASSDAELTPLYHALQKEVTRYSDEELIGKGGMKEVVKTYDARTERQVALARPKDSIGPERYDAFLREAHITGRLDHPNIIKIFDMGIDEQKRPFFTMEFKRGLSLREILSNLKKGESETEFPLQRRLQIFLRICEAMAFAHSRHVLHLDLKPENVQVGAFGEVQVCDWGMGEIERGESEQHLSEALLDPDLYGDQLEPAIKGTPGYMAPELEQPRTLKSPAHDVYALGCLLYEIATLNPLTLRLKSPPISPAIAAIVKKACAQNPHNRYSSVELLHQDVTRHLTGHSPAVHSAGFFRESRLFFRRNRLPCILTLGFSLLFLTIGLLFAQQLRKNHGLLTKALTATEESLFVAEKERASAQQALQRYELEREYSSALLACQDGTVTEKTVFLIHNLMMKEGISLPAVENALSEIDRELEKNPPSDDRLWSLKGHLLFLTQRFAEAEKSYAIKEGSQGYLRKLIPEYAPLIRDNGILPAADFKRLIHQLSMASLDRQPLAERMIIYDSLKRNSPKETAEFIEVMLQISNKEWTRGHFRYDPETEHLEIHGPSFHSLYRRNGRRKSPTIPARSLIRIIPLKSVAFRNTQLHSFWHLTGLKIQSLDIRGHTPLHLEALGKMPDLQKLVIESGQLSQEQIDALPERITVHSISVH